MSDIAYQNRDVISKFMGEILEGKSLAVYGRPDIQVVRSEPTNLPAVEANELRIDQLYTLQDGSVAILDYESTHDREDIVKYINYVARIIKRLYREYQDKVPDIRMIVLYSADIKSVRTVSWNFGCMRFSIEPVFLVGMNTEEIYRQIAVKVKNREELSDEELLQLIVLPLTVKGKEGKQLMAEEAVELAKDLLDGQSTFALAGILTFADKILDEDYKNRIKEEIRMLQIERMIFEDGVEEGVNQEKNRRKKERNREIQALVGYLQKMGNSKNKVSSAIVETFKVSEKKAREYVSRYWKTEMSVKK